MAKSKTGAPRKILTFTELLAKRINTLGKYTKAVQRQFTRSGKGSAAFAAINAGLVSLAAEAQTIPPDFKPARSAAVGNSQPMIVGSEIEIVAKKQESYAELFGESVSKGKWIVTNVTRERIVAKAGDAASAFPRRDVQLFGVPRVARAPKVDANGKPVARKPRKAKSATAVAAAATL